MDPFQGTAAVPDAGHRRGEEVPQEQRLGALDGVGEALGIREPPLDSAIEGLEVGWALVSHAEDGDSREGPGTRPR